MSPEQAKGRVADRRSDVWAFGCVFFEMLTGKRVFDGEDVSETLAAVLRADPDWNALPADVPPGVRSAAETLSRARSEGAHSGNRHRPVPAAGRVDAAAGARRPRRVVAAPKRPLWKRAVPVALAAIVGRRAGNRRRLVSQARAAARPSSRFVVSLPDGVTFTGTGRHYVAHLARWRAHGVRRREPPVSAIDDRLRGQTHPGHRRASERDGTRVLSRRSVDRVLCGRSTTPSSESPSPAARRRPSARPRIRTA